MKRLVLYFICGIISVSAAAQHITQGGITSQASMTESLDALLQANAYPNPVTSSVNIDLDMRKAAVIRLKITDLIGKEVYRTNLQFYDAGSHTLNIPMATTSPGVYFFNIIDEAGYTAVSGRFIKQ